MSEIFMAGPDISKEDAQVQAICNAVWTTTVKNAKKAANEASGL